MIAIRYLTNCYTIVHRTWRFGIVNILEDGQFPRVEIYTGQQLLSVLGSIYREPDIGFSGYIHHLSHEQQTRLDDLTYNPSEISLHTTKLSSDFAGTFATAVFPRWIEA
jgi:hypothetical protein